MTMAQAKEKYFACMEKYAPKNEKWSFKKTMGDFDLSPIEKSYGIVFHNSIKEYLNTYSHTKIFGDCVTKDGYEICIVLEPTFPKNLSYSEYQIVRSMFNLSYPAYPKNLSYSEYGFYWSLDIWMKKHNDKTHTPIGVDGGDLYACCDVVVDNLTGKTKININDNAGNVVFREFIADDLADLISTMADSLEFNSFFIEQRQAGN